MREKKINKNAIDCFAFAAILLILCLIEVISGRQHRPKLPMCRPSELFTSIYICHAADSNVLQLNELCLQITLNSRRSPPIFLFYDVNAFEGFNLRRDVYIRMAVFIRALRRIAGYENAILVLPPFHHLYHWQLVQSPNESGRDEIVFWTFFFDLPSLRRFTAVIDLWQYFDLMRSCFGHHARTPHRLDRVLKLKHFESMFSSGKFEERFEVLDDCSEADKRSVRQQFIGLYTNFTISKAHCVEFQGSAILLADLLKKYPKTYGACESISRRSNQLIESQLQEFTNIPSNRIFECRDCVA